MTSAPNEAASTTAVESEQPPFELSPVELLPMPAQALGDSVEIGDVTGDGLDDVVVAGNLTWPAHTGIVWVSAQKADGTLSQPVSYPFGSSNWTGKLVLGDLNNDSVKDIVVGHGDGISLMVSDRQGGFSLVRAGNVSTLDVGVVDIDLDGLPDVVGQTDDSGMILFFGDGMGGVRTTSTLPSAALGSNDLAVGDMNDDGLDDVVVSSARGLGEIDANFWIYPHDGIGGFKPPKAYRTPTDAWYPNGVAIGDFNSDGLNDVVLSEPKNSPAHLYMYLQDANGGLQQAQALASYDIPGNVLVADLDRDGRDDLLAAHRGWFAIGYYLQGGDGLEQERLAPAQAGFDMAAGDTNGDDCTDVVFVDSAGRATRMLGKNCRPPRPAPVSDDVNGDGKSDLLWRNDAQTHWNYWTMDAADIVGAMSFPVGPAWRVVARADFNGDGRLDVIWTDGRAMVMWVGDGAAYAGVAMSDYPAGWRVVAVGDADGDRKADILWRSESGETLVVWRMDGASILHSKGYGISPAWRVAGSGDLDGDGLMDLVMSDGRTMRSWTGKANLTYRVAAMGAYPTGWEFAGLADLDGDGRSDLLWRHAAAGYFVHWTMIGPTRIADTVYQVDGAWRLLRTGDYNGDGIGDIIWTNGDAMVMWASSEQSFLGLPMPRYPAGWFVSGP